MWNMTYRQFLLRTFWHNLKRFHKSSLNRREAWSALVEFVFPGTAEKKARKILMESIAKELNKW